MRIVFSNHARMQLHERNLPRSVVAGVVKNPEKIVRQRLSRFRAQRSMTVNRKNYLLIVVYDETDGMQEIVTAFITTKFKKYL